MSKGAFHDRSRGRALWTCALEVGGLVISTVLLFALFAGCGDPVSRYRLLSFFFDGVPVPPELATEDPNATTQPVDANSPGAIASRAATREAEILYHAPYRNRQCVKCHSETGSFEVSVNKDICRGCHLRHYDLPADDWVHGPLVVGKCSMCHLSHQSQYAGLLVKSERDLCFDCHNRSDTLARAFHAEARTGAKTCGACHDPHSAGNRLLLVDSHTHLRRAFRRRAVATPHADWKQKDCRNCHVAEKSNEVLAPEAVNKACTTCHDKEAVQDIGQPKLHEAVSDGKCIACHTPHRSQQPHLIRPTADRICTGCHKPKDFNKAPHPPVVRANCLLCHTGHKYEREHMLKSFDIPASTTAPATMPAVSGASGPATRPAPSPAADKKLVRPDLPGGRP